MSQNSPVKSDEERLQDAYNEALKEWIGVLRSLWTAFDKQVDEGLAVEYYREFCFLPLSLLEVIVTRCKREYNYFPNIHQVWKIFNSEMNRANCVGQSPEDQACQWLYRKSSRVVYVFEGASHELDPD